MVVVVSFVSLLDMSAPLRRIPLLQARPRAIDMLKRGPACANQFGIAKRKSRRDIQVSGGR
jgi:hypothetical protein